MNSIDGKYALVTGGTQGLGAAIAQNFAMSGAKGIVTIGRNEEKGSIVANKINKKSPDTDRVNNRQTCVCFEDNLYLRGICHIQHIVVDIYLKELITCTLFRIYIY